MLKTNDIDYVVVHINNVYYPIQSRTVEPKPIYTLLTSHDLAPCLKLLE